MEAWPKMGMDNVRLKASHRPGYVKNTKRRIGACPCLPGKTYIHPSRFEMGGKNISPSIKDQELNLETPSHEPGQEVGDKAFGSAGG